MIEVPNHNSLNLDPSLFDEEGRIGEAAPSFGTSEEQLIGDTPSIKATKAHANSRLWLWRIWATIGVCVLVVAAGLVLRQLGTALGLIFAVAFIVFILRHPVDWFEKKGLSRSAGCILVYLIMLLILAGIIWLVIPPLVNEASNMGQSLPGYVATVSDWFNAIALKYQDFFNTYNIVDMLNTFKDELGTQISSVVQNSATGILNAGTSIVSVVTIIVLALLAGYWILRDLPAFGRELRVLAGPRRGGDMLLISKLCARVFDGYIKGTLLVAAFIAVAASLAFLIIGLPSSVLMGIMLGLLRIIPYIGPIIGVLTVTLLGLITRGWIIGIITLAVSVVIVEIGGLLILPKIMSSEVELHPAIILIVTIAGGALFGAAGMVLATPVVAAIKAVFVYYFEKRTGRELLSKEGVLFQGEPDRRLDEFSDEELDWSASSKSSKGNSKYAYSTPTTFMSFLSVNSHKNNASSGRSMRFRSQGGSRKKSPDGDTISSEQKQATVEQNHSEEVQAAVDMLYDTKD